MQGKYFVNKSPSFGVGFLNNASMLYTVIANSVSINGRTYRKGDEVSSVRFSPSQAAELVANGSVKDANPPAPTPAPKPVQVKKETAINPEPTI